jgi:hypothetical protein
MYRKLLILTAFQPQGVAITPLHGTYAAIAASNDLKSSHHAHKSGLEGDVERNR